MDAISSYIAARLDEYLALLTRACAQPSISAQGEGLIEMADMTAGMLRDADFDVELAPPAGAPIIVGRLAGQGPHTLLFYNHYDVQPVDPLDEWITPPFAPAVREERLYGRGVADNKGAIVARLCALAAYRAIHGALPVHIVWVIEGDEEIGSPHLEPFAARHAELLRGVYGCVWESGGRDARGRYEIALGCKGILHVDLRARGAGRDLHSAMAAIVGSPVWRLVWALNALKGPDERVRIPGFYDDVRPITPVERQALAEWDYPEEEVRALYQISEFLGGMGGARLKEQLMFSPTCNVDGFHAGYGGPGSKTVLPCEARAKLDFRLVPDQDPLRIAHALRAYLDAEGFSDVEITSCEGERASAGDPAHPFVQMAADVARRVYGQPPVILPMMSATGPIYPLCGQFGVPVVTAGVGYAGSQIHAPNEHILLSDFVAGARYIAALLEAFAA